MSMRLAISLFSAVTVLVVSTVTFTVTYLTSLDTVESVGRSYASSLASTARAKTEALFHVPAMGAISLAQSLRRYENFRLPTEDPTMWTVLDRCVDAVARSTLLAPSDTFLSTILFDDGSRVAVGIRNENSAEVLSLTALHAGSINQSSPDKCCGTPYQAFYYLSNMSVYPFPADPIQGLNDARVGLYLGLRGLFVNRPTGLWNRITYNNAVANPNFAFSFVFPLRNATTFIGVYIAAISTAQITTFLRELDVTPNTVSFAVDTDGVIVASTHPAEYRTYTNTTLADVVVPVNCFHTAGLNAQAAVHVIACRSFARDFPYEPLRAVADDRAMMRPLASDAKPTITTVSTGGEGVVIATALGISNVAAALPVSLLIFMPQSDILGPIITTRNIVIGVVIAVVVIASVLSFLFTAHVLGALDRVASKMRQTAKLRDRHNNAKPPRSPNADAIDVEGEDRESSEGTSGLAEIYDIQRAYGDMAVAIGSFTRYVPRDVVRDLLRSGELCTLSMTPRRCTMLFSDIRGFTSMCERVPTADLSELIHGYFERMTRLVGTHGGIVDKFIGDAVMAVWGAPFPCGNPELRATLCGLRMTRETKVAPLAPLFDSAGEQLRIRVGVASGDVLAGNMGSAERMSYTVIGDAVNLAARLESFCKQVGVEMLVCATTARELGDAVALRLLMKLRVTGKAEGVKVFEAAGVASRFVPPDMLDIVKREDAAGAADDSQSVRSQMSIAAASDGGSRGAASGEGSGIGGHYVLKGDTTVNLYEAAGRTDPEPLLVDDTTLASIAAYSHAASLFIRGDFAKSLALLDDPAGPVQGHFGDTDLALQLLRQAAQENQRTPPADFDGTIAAASK